jgi:hypothetical protein
MCPQLPRLSPEYSHKAGLQTVITGIPLQLRPVTRGSHTGPVTMGRIVRGPLSWTRPHCGMTSSPVFVWCRSSEVRPCLFCLCQSSGCSEGFERRVASLPSPQHKCKKALALLFLHTPRSTTGSGGEPSSGELIPATILKDWCSNLAET